MTRAPVFTLRWLDGYEVVQPFDLSVFDYLAETLNGSRRAAEWRPIQVRLLTADNGDSLLTSDAPYMTEGALVLRSTAADKLRIVLADFAEVLPLDCSDADLVVVNVTCVADALDQGKSAVARLPGGRIFKVFHHEFRADIVEGKTMFKIPDMRVSDIFVSSAFVEAWNSAGLSGLAFGRVWEGPLRETQDWPD